MNDPDSRNNNWTVDFKAFLSSEEMVPPNPISTTILTKVRADLNPSFKKVLGKLALVHLVVGITTILFCPQLGVGFFSGRMGLMAFFMRFGALACAALCGSVFLGLSMGLGAIILRREELRVAKRFQFFYASVLSAISLSCLMLLGGSGNAFEFLSWLAGAVSGAWIGLEMVALIRIRKLSPVLR